MYIFIHCNLIINLHLIFSIQKSVTNEPVKIVERRREISEIIIIDNNVEMDENDDDDYENNERLNKIPILD